MEITTKKGGLEKTRLCFALKLFIIKEAMNRRGAKILSTPASNKVAHT